MKQKCNFIRQILWMFVATALLAGLHSCEDDDVNQALTLQYMGVQNIGTGMTFQATPYYKGLTPSNFTISKIKLNGEPQDVTGFVIDAATGVVTITYNNQLAAGEYKLTISCMAGGSALTFEDVLTVNMLSAAPAVFKYQAPVLTFEYGYIDTAFVKEISESVTISKFVLDPNGDGKYFQIDAKTGMVTLNPENKIDEPYPGHYKPTVGIVTAASTQYYPGTIEFNITSKPLALTYDPNSFQIEQNGSDTTKMPTYKGSPDELAYTIKSVTPATDKIKIDPVTGRIYAVKDNALGIDEYKVAVTMTNKYGTNDFTDVFSCNVITFIEPISNFAYPETTVTRTKAIEVSKADDFKGGYVTFAFDGTLPANLTGLSIDATTGKITAPANNKIPTGDYTIPVKATNAKGSATAIATLKVVEHPNFFTVVYGNNLGLAPAKDYANQFIVSFPPKNGPPSTLDVTPIIEPQATGITHTIVHQTGTDGSTNSININTSTGAISYEKTTYSKKAGGIFYALIRATKGSGEDVYTVETPVFLRMPPRLDANVVDIQYKPFVLKVNPKTGYTSNTPEYESNPSNLATTMKLVVDYKDEVQYYDFSGNSSLSGVTSKAGTLTNHLWTTYYSGGTINLGSREPISGIDKFETTKSKKLCYIKQDGSFQLYVTPEIWKDQYGKYANGAFIARMTYTIDDKDPSVSGANAEFPIILWFSTDF